MVSTCHEEYLYVFFFRQILPDHERQVEQILLRGKLGETWLVHTGTCITLVGDLSLQPLLLYHNLLIFAYADYSGNLHT